MEHSLYPLNSLETYFLNGRQIGPTATELLFFIKGKVIPREAGAQTSKYFGKNSLHLLEWEETSFQGQWCKVLFCPCQCRARRG